VGRLWRWFTSKFRRDRQYHDFTGVARVGPGEDPEREVKRRKLVLVGPAEKPKWLRFSCPCRCGAVIALNLMKSHSPCWTVEVHADGTLTLHPSVDATTCGSHFWIRRNRIHWV
jgi:hypothetical protein